MVEMSSVMKNSKSSFTAIKSTCEGGLRPAVPGICRTQADVENEGAG